MAQARPVLAFENVKRHWFEADQPYNEDNYNLKPFRT